MTSLNDADLAAIALTSGIDQGQVVRSAGFQKIIFQGDGEMLGEADADEAAGGDGIAVTDQAHRFLGGDELALAGEGLGGEQGMGMQGWH